MFKFIILFYCDALKTFTNKREKRRPVIFLTKLLIIVYI